jgi:DDE family transposase
MPKLADSEVITMELVGTYLGLSQDQEVFDYFRRHYAHFFPEMGQVARTTFVRQAANLWAVKERLWCLIRDSHLLYDPTVAIVDSMPIPVCQFARAYRCHRFDDTASFGKDHTSRQTFYGFRLHLRLCWPGVITQMYLAPANVHEGEVVWDLTADTWGLLLGDRNYWLPTLQAALRKLGVILQAPFRKARRAACSQLESRTGPRALSHRHRLWATDRSLRSQAGLGTGCMASAQSFAAYGSDAYDLCVVQFARSGSSAPIRSLGCLKNLHIGLVT